MTWQQAKFLRQDREGNNQERKKTQINNLDFSIIENCSSKATQKKINRQAMDLEKILQNTLFVKGSVSEIYKNYYS